MLHISWIYYIIEIIIVVIILVIHGSDDDVNEKIRGPEKYYTRISRFLLSLSLFLSFLSILFSLFFLVIFRIFCCFDVYIAPLHAHSYASFAGSRLIANETRAACTGENDIVAVAKLCYLRGSSFRVLEIPCSLSSRDVKDKIVNYSKRSVSIFYFPKFFLLLFRSLIRFSVRL